MFDPEQVTPLTEFQRNAKEFVKRLHKSGRPELLTINGRAAVVVQDAAAFKSMIDRLEGDYLHEAVQVGIEQMEAGKGRPLSEVVRDLKSRRAGAQSRRKSA
ncbi:hypothetical protein PHYC_03228 [Phycisphaerales bacterium]|nr:hypothetical protein PHYC_03228 [Phycisphaerales bacterium]